MKVPWTNRNILRNFFIFFSVDVLCFLPLQEEEYSQGRDDLDIRFPQFPLSDNAV